LIAGFATFYLCLGFSSDAHASPAPNLHGDSWLLVVTAGVLDAGFSRGKSFAHQGHVLRAAHPGVVFRFGFPDGACRIPDAAYACLKRAVSDLCVEYVFHSYSSALIKQHWEHR
jgi:hypothetical protein